MKTKRVRNNTFRIVYIEDFWKWAEKNKASIDFTKMEKNILGKEPEWLESCRRNNYITNSLVKQTPWTKEEDEHLKWLINQYKFTIKEISNRLQRSCGAIQRRLTDLNIKGRPIKADNHIKWTSEEFDILADLIKEGASYEVMSEIIGKSSKAIRGIVYRMYLTENLTKATAIIGDGSWGDNRPERPITHNTLTTGERMQVKKDMTRFVRLLKGEICKYYDDNDYWQREICQHWNDGCEAGEMNCDTCTSFIRIRAQYCKRCGKTFTERGENNFCLACRQQRKKQAQKKYAIINGKRIYNFERSEE